MQSWRDALIGASDPDLGIAAIFSSLIMDCRAVKLDAPDFKGDVEYNSVAVSVFNGKDADYAAFYICVVDVDLYRLYDCDGGVGADESCRVKIFDDLACAGVPCK